MRIAVSFEAVGPGVQAGLRIAVRGVGKKYNWDKGIGEGISSYAKAYSKWKHTKKAMDLWAQRLKTTLDELAGEAKGV